MQFFRNGQWYNIGMLKTLYEGPGLNTRKSSHSPEVKKQASKEVKAKPEVNDSIIDKKALRAEYKELYGKGVAPKYINDVEWIKNKISEKLNSNK